MGSSKKKRHSNKANTPVVRTVDCPHCSESIAIPNKCQHGKKPINCRGTNCANAHVTEHNEKCPAKLTRTLAQAGRAEAKARAEATKAAKEELAVLHALIEQELRNFEKIRGKEMKYLTGVPREDILKAVKKMDVHNSRTMARMLENLAEGRMDMGEARYDDETSDTEVEGCLTPPEEEEASEQALEERQPPVEDASDGHSDMPLSIRHHAFK